MKRIPLTQGQFALVDDADFDRLSAHSWHVHKTTSGDFYAARTGCRPRQRKILMHRELFPGVSEVDHKNRNKLDNRRSNLRPATHTQNLGNSGRPKHNTSGFKGASLDKRSGKWKAQIQVASKSVWLGSFDTRLAAARAYDTAAKKQFGEFACLNSPVTRNNA
jgi:AP2 domain/HNH endonuclease